MKQEQIMVISVMDQDRPGIVAEITEQISRLGGNLMDLRESVLSGWFTMILSAGFPSDLTVGQIELELEKATSSRVSVALHEGPIEEPVASGFRYVLTAMAEDRIGLVAAVSRFCCEKNVNILDLASHVEGSHYTMMLLLDLAGIEEICAFRSELAEFGHKSGLRLVLQHNDIFHATNEI
jgi:glycine cleavage system transcriptional repressor